MKIEDILNLMVASRYVHEDAIKAYYTESQYHKDSFVATIKEFKVKLDQALMNMEVDQDA